LQPLRDLAGTDRVGTNVLGLLQAAEKLGFSAKGVKGLYDALPQVPLPAIAHVVREGLDHFVFLQGDEEHGCVGQPRPRRPETVL
jgi:ATP-binding cassette subfamily B protein